MQRQQRALRPVLALVALMLGTTLVLRARASARELLLSAGEPLLAYAGAAHDAGERTLIVNGARLRMRTGTTVDDPSTVLDAYENECQSRTDWLEPVLRIASRSQGVVGCFFPSAGTTLLTRLQRAHASGDLSALGELRVVWVRRDEHGARYVALASEGALRIGAMFPSEGHAEGSDVPSVPPPEDALRLLSVWQADRAPMLVSYLHPRSALASASEYAQTLHRAGVRTETVPAEVYDELALLAHTKNGLLVALFTPQDTHTAITLLPLFDESAAALATEPGTHR